MAVALVHPFHLSADPLLGRGFAPVHVQALNASPMPHANSGNTGQKKPAPVNAQIAIRKALTSR
jgi:hypothetical protein